jgi:hypothetical protein
VVCSIQPELIDVAKFCQCISSFRREVAEDGTLTWTHMESHSKSISWLILMERY